MGSTGGGDAGRQARAQPRSLGALLHNSSVSRHLAGGKALHTAVGDEDRVGVRIDMLVLPPQFTQELPELHSG